VIVIAHVIVDVHVNVIAHVIVDVNVNVIAHVIVDVNVDVDVNGGALLHRREVRGDVAINLANLQLRSPTRAGPAHRGPSV
jgi:hypothetical protein